MKGALLVLGRTGRRNIKRIKLTHLPNNFIDYSPSNQIINDLQSSERFLRHYVIEILAGDLSAVAGRALQHLLEFLDVHGLAQFLGHPADVVGVYQPRVIVVEEVEDLVDAVLCQSILTLDSLSPRREVMPSRNSSKSTYLPSPSRSAIMLKMVGFLLSKPRLCMALFSYLGSILPVASVSKRLKASRSSSISSSVSPGRSIFFLAGPFTPGFALVAILTNLNKL